MARHVTGQVLGGQPKAGIEADTVQDVYDALGLDGNFTATINGEPADMDDELDEYSFVSFSAAVKGGC